MKHKFEEQAHDYLNALKKEITDFPNALKSLKKKAEEVQGISYLRKLPKLVFFLTNVTKKKSIREKFILPEKTRGWGKEEVEIGINCNGLGYVDWGSQLTPITSEYELKNGYEIDSDNLKVLMCVFNDEELCLDIADAILKKNRKDFLRLASFFRKQNIKPEELSREVKTSKVKIRFSRMWSIEDIKSTDGNEQLSYYSRDFVEGETDRNLLEDCKINELLFLGVVISQEKELAKSIKEKITHLEERAEKQKELNEFVGEMILTYEALENL